MSIKRCIQKGIIYFRNSIKATHNHIELPSIHNSNNRINLNGEMNSFIVDENGYMRSSFCFIEGTNNRIYTGKNSILTNQCSIRISGNNNHVVIEDDCLLNRMSIYIAGDNNKVRLSQHVSVVQSSFHMENDNNVIEIGKGTSLHGRENGFVELVLEESTSITIKDDCMISNGVSFRSSDSHSVLDEKGERTNPAGNIVINNHVWIGMRSLILKNTVIYENCVVGAGSLCNKEYKEGNCLIAGNPAKIIKKRVNWSRDRI